RDLIAPQIHGGNRMQRLSILVTPHDALLFQDARNRKRVGALVCRFGEFNRDHLHVLHLWWIPGKHKTDHLLEGFLLFRSGFLVEVDRTVYFACILVDQVPDNHCLKAIHLYVPEMPVLDVGEIGGVAASMCGMAIGTTRTGIGGASAFGKVDAVHLEIGNGLGYFLGLLGCAGPGKQSNGQREYKRYPNSRHCPHLLFKTECFLYSESVAFCSW